MTPTKVEKALAEFIEQMDILRDDFVRYQEGHVTVPFVVLRESLVAALTAYDQIDLTAALAERERDAARYRWLRENNGSWKVQTAITKKEGDDHRWVYAIEGLDAAIDAAMKDADYSLSDAELDATTDYRGHDPTTTGRTPTMPADKMPKMPERFLTWLAEFFAAAFGVWK